MTRASQPNRHYLSIPSPIALSCAPPAYPPLPRAAARSVPSIIGNAPPKPWATTPKSAPRRLILPGNRPRARILKDTGRGPRRARFLHDQRGLERWAMVASQRSLPLSAPTWLWMACIFDRLDYRGPSQPLRPNWIIAARHDLSSTNLRDPPAYRVDRTALDRHLDKSHLPWQVQPGCISD